MNTSIPRAYAVDLCVVFAQLEVDWFCEADWW